MSISIKELEFNIENLILNKSENFLIAKEIEKFISDYKSGLKQFFLDSQNRGKQFLVKNTRFYDSIISLIYKTILREMFGNYLPMRNSIPIVIVALGSYGREELSIHSDIDLMVTYQDVAGYNTLEIIEKFVYMAWDSGLKLGHRVHNISEIESIANSDHTIKTALIESRKVIGSQFIWGNLESRLNIVRETDVLGFILNKNQEIEKIQSKIEKGLIESDLKEGFGGLRDANRIFWILNVLYKVSNIKDLSGTLFKEEEFRRFSIALDFIYQVRTALHLSVKKKRDKFTLEDIPNLADMLSFNSHKIFTHKLLYSFSVIYGFSTKIIRNSIKPFLFKQENFAILRKSFLAKSVFLKDNELLFSSNIKFNSIENFLIFLNNLPDINFKNGKTTYSLINSIDNISGVFDNFELIVNLFKRKFLFPIIEILHISETLEKILKPFEKVMFLPQFDGFHKHPVDIHSIYTIKELELDIKNVFLKDLYKSLSESEHFILKVASLFHDIGKGRIEEHSRVGAKVVKTFLKNSNLEDELIDRITTLIRHHTLMTHSSYHEDIYDEKVIFSFTSKIKDEINLKLLYLLTFADVKSVNSNSYNSYNQNLLHSFYLNALGSFGNKEMLKESEKRDKKEITIKNSEIFKSSPRIIQKALLNIKSNKMFFKLSIDNIMEITKKAKKLDGFSYEIDNSKFLSINILRDINSNFNVAYFLNRFNFLSVISLDIFELFNGVKYFQIDFLNPVSEEDKYFIDFIIEDSFSKNRKTFKDILPKILRSEISIDYEYSNNYIKMTIFTINQNGLLAYLFKLFEDNKIDVISSKTETFKKRVKDTFLFKRGNDLKKHEKLVELIIKEN